MINLLWDAVAAVVTHSTSVPQTYPPCPQHTHSNLAHVHSTTESWLSIALLSCCGSYLNVWRLAFYQKTILLLTKCSNDNVDENSDMHGIREFFEAYSVSFIYF